MNIQNKIKIYSIVYILVILINLLCISKQSVNCSFIMKPIIVLTIFLMYTAIVDKIKWFYALSLICVFIGDIFYLFETKYILLAMFFYTINHIALTFEIFKFKKRRMKINNIFSYSFVLFILLISVYFLVVKDQQGHNTSVIPFGVSLCVLSATALVNYLKNMTKPNFYLMFGMIMSILTTLTISLNPFSLSSTKSINILATLFLGITHYIICYSFIIRAKDRA